ncbi:MAG: Pycsar system effector family protein, partial [Lysobacteraceae bacterium]
RLKPGEPLPQHFNLLFFGHFAELDQERFLREFVKRLKPDGSIYRTMARDVHSLGSYLAHHKYRYLRASYLSFLTGFVLATGFEMWKLIAH